MSTTAFITGATRGIGEAIALRLAEQGYRLFLLGRDQEALENVAAACRQFNVEVDIAHGDLGDESYMAQSVERAIQGFGSIDVLVNNAGAAHRQATQSADLSAWRDVMDLNFNAVMFLCRESLPHMIEKKRGTIINISSISGRNTNAGGAIYCASKHALNGFSGCMYEDVREHGIKVCTIMPGFVDTGLTQDLGLNAAAMIQPSDIADAVQYIVSASSNCCPTEIVIRPQQRP
ncbi:MAG: SDR family oxidoreductase [Pseudomonadota bacterium]